MFDLIMLGLGISGLMESRSNDPLTPAELRTLPNDVRQMLGKVVPSGEVIRKRHVKEARERIMAQQQRAAMP
ncbi:MAG: hypothetical protein GAK28_04353 [Luteibacter sp.]|uniref:hypothetical protein n=1 Tax=Luteibacter sp. TaxID=1886636 RepID=UPI00138620A9|nr:hypothetical protein [Luteibacter sp.]KAF1003890.1 MAG: hypothetical protein GAK28_04353 [Luteibacter sp.]